MFDRRTMIAKHTWNMAVVIAALAAFAVLAELVS